MAESIAGPGTGRDPAGANVDMIGAVEVGELERLLNASGIGHISLQRRYSVVFVYPGIGAGDEHPELAGCTAEVCTFADQTTEFVKHGFQLAGLSTGATAPPGDFLTTLPFPVGQLPPDTVTPVLEFVERRQERFAVRTSFVVFPDGSGVKVTNITDPVAHVRRCFDIAIAHRLRVYERAVVTALGRSRGGFESSLQHEGFLPNGADSVSISTVDLRVRLVAKMADPNIVLQEGGYIERVNRLLEESGRPRVFPTIYAICGDERPGYYLMEAADPLTLDGLLFADDAMTSLRPDRVHLLGSAMTKLTSLYTLTFRQEEPAIARYHYLDRFLAIPERQDFRSTFEFLLPGRGTVDELLACPLVVDGDFVCRPYNDQMAFLKQHVDDLAQPVGAYLHGDVHLKNMLVGRDMDVLFVDPRVVWDGNDVGDHGWGDPLYDYGTLLHSVHTMSSILNAIDREETECLLSVEHDSLDGERALVIWPGALHITGSGTVDWFVDWLERTAPRHVLGDQWRARLHVNAANALVGWLKYARALRTGHAWMAVYASALYHLEVARRELEGEGNR